MKVDNGNAIKLLRIENKTVCNAVTTLTFKITVINLWPSDCLFNFDVLSWKMCFHGNTSKSFIFLSVPEQT